MTIIMKVYLGNISSEPYTSECERAVYPVALKCQ